MCYLSVSSSQAKPSLTNNAANAANVGGKAMNSFKKAVAIKADSEEAKPLMSASNGRYDQRDTINWADAKTTQSYFLRSTSIGIIMQLSDL